MQIKKLTKKQYEASRKRRILCGDCGSRYLSIGMGVNYLESPELMVSCARCSRRVRHVCPYETIFTDGKAADIFTKRSLTRAISQALDEFVKPSGYVGAEIIYEAGEKELDSIGSGFGSYYLDEPDKRLIENAPKGEEVSNEKSNQS